MADATCHYAGCKADCAIERTLRGQGTVYCYCADHDPLDDPDVADNWTEVGGSDE